MIQTAQEQRQATNNACRTDGIVRCDGTMTMGTKIFRYLSVDRYLELVEDGFNALTHLSLWEDPYEAFILRAGITYKNGEHREDIYNVFKNVYGQSWTLRKNESDVIWRAMGKRGDVVRIQTTIGKLADSLILVGSEKLREHVLIAPVTYLSKREFDTRLVAEELNLAVNGKTSEKIKFFFMKRNEFSLEEEVRVLAIPDENELDKVTCKKGHLLKFRIESVDFIEDVLADPMMDRRKYEQIVCRTRHVSQLINVRQSGLFSWPTIPDGKVVYAAGDLVDVEDIPDGDLFHAYLTREGKSKDNIRSIECRVRRVFNRAPHGAVHVTFEELRSILDNMENYVENADSAANCKVAIRHYMKAMFGRDDRGW